jgi:hypothetical protein
VAKGRWLVASLLALAAGALTHAQQPRIQFAEPVQISAQPGVTEFDAYGRRFTLELTPNDRLLAKLPAQRKASLGSRVLRGRLAGQPGSWVRLTAFAGRIEGAIWDGHDLYAVARYRDVAQALINPLPVAPDQIVVFRLSDTRNLFPPNFCPVDTSPAATAASGLDQYKSLVGELRSNALSTPVTKQMNVALIADLDFQDQATPDVSGEMLARFNVADGIFADQVGLLLNASQIDIVGPADTSFTATDAGVLLNQVSTYRAAHTFVRDAAIAHLMTGKSLDDSVIGIATLGGVCDANRGVSLSNRWFGATAASGVVMAHELGHNLGAVHDGPGGACGDVPQGYIMWPYGDGSANRFSQCSLDTMRPIIDRAACISAATVADVTVSLSSGPTGELQVPMTLSATVTSVGANPVQDVNVRFDIPASLSVNSISTSLGSCTLSQAPSCALGDMAGGALRNVSLNVTPLEVTPSVLVTAEVTAANDRVANNNTTSTRFEVINSADASVSVSPGSASVRIGDPVDYTITLRSIRTRAVINARIDLAPPGLGQVTYTPSAGTCSAAGSCLFGDLPPGAVVTLAVHGVAANAGAWQHAIRLDTQNDDGTNNFASFNLSIAPNTNVAITGMPLATISVGATYVTQFTVRNTVGVRAAGNVRVRLTSDASAPIQAATVTGGTCTVDSGSLANCQLGDMPVDDARTVAVTILATGVALSQVGGRVSADLDESSADDTASNSLQIRNPVDLRVVGIQSANRVESREGTDRVPIYSQSTLAATDFVATVELPATAHLTRLALADATCQVIDAQHGRCSAATLAHLPTRELQITAIGDSPGAQRVRVSIAANSEADPSDNAAEYDLQIIPYLDVSISPITLPQFVYVGQTLDIESRLRTAYRDVQNVTLKFFYPREVSITGVEPAGCATQRDAFSSYDALVCEFPLLPANTDRLLRFQFRALSTPEFDRFVALQAQLTTDVDLSNNYSSRLVRVVEDSDVAVEVASGSPSAEVGSGITLPRITLRSTRNTRDITLKIPLPTFASVSSVTPGGICTGTAILECPGMNLTPGQELSFDIVLTANQPGTFTSRVEVTAFNDTVATNNAAEITMTARPSTLSANPPAGRGVHSGGGGGRLDWSVALMLALLYVRRQRRIMSREKACGLRH